MNSEEHNIDSLIEHESKENFDSGHFIILQEHSNYENLFHHEEFWSKEDVIEHLAEELFGNKIDNSYYRERCKIYKVVELDIDHYIKEIKQKQLEIKISKLEKSISEYPKYYSFLQSKIEKDKKIHDEEVLELQKLKNQILKP